ncbi:MAG: Fatty acid oxidation complex subunit alpha [Gemmatimonadaceae bacterium]|nr:Fatty acid oxidation complex subunit alpha [Gemmatimonadaceae bacterium]
MTEVTQKAVVGVIGAGAMGSGIAHVAALHGHRVVLADAAEGAVDRARSNVARALAREVEKGRLSADHAAATLDRITPSPNGAPDLAPCDIVIETVVERLDVKLEVMRALEMAVPDDTLLATNTSSLSIASIAGGCRRPERVVGMHFFNPATSMPLVEIVAGARTEPAVGARVKRLAEEWGKTVVLAKDTPGFIVNRIARPFYGEAIRIAEEGIATPATIDWAMKTLGGFRMGPFELMDFIGHDVNYVVTETVWRAMYFDARYRPSIVQQRLLEAGLLGRKAGRGFYDYAAGSVAPAPTQDPSLGASIFSRVLAMLINEAVDALYLQVATADAIDVAMTKGMNYPKGLLAWGEAIGWAQILATLDALRTEYGEERYRASVLLRRLARDGTRISR